MKKIIYVLAVVSVMVACKSSQQKSDTSDLIVTNIDLAHVKNDRVMVSVDPGIFKTSTTTFYIPKTVPGTYSTDNYGRFIDSLKAIDYDGRELAVKHPDENSWEIANAEQLDKVTYWVNDSYDIEGEKGVFSPAGTNIDAGNNFMLNLHGFVGYFKGMAEKPYQLIIKHPKNFVAGTSLGKTKSSQKKESADYGTDEFMATRYFEVTDHPIMYSEPDTISFELQGMHVLLDVYSPNKKYSAKDIEPSLKKMMTAQKNFMGNINKNKRYAVQLYLADLQKTDAKGFGALEHHTSTTVVLPESMPLEKLSESLKDVVSHEFFHTITPLSVHSKEIHYFDYNDPKMSEHLWMYEGVTEYFANLFQVNQDLISNQDFYNRMAEKIETSKSFDETVPFTVLSKNILTDEYKDSYYNVYQKGALIGMCLDIRLRELSDGKMGVLDLMGKLSNKYGANKPFDDKDLISAIVNLTYPEIQQFFDAYVTGTTPIPYNEFLTKVGLHEHTNQIDTQYFLKGQTPYIDGSPDSGELFFREGITYNSFLEKLGVQPNDVIKSVNGKSYDVNNVYALIVASQSWKPGDELSFVVEREGAEKTLTAEAVQPTASEIKIEKMDIPQSDKRVELREAWLKN